MISRKIVLIILNHLILGAFGFVGIFFVARYMGAEALGIIGFSFGFIGLFAIFGDLGFGTAHIKRVSEGKDLRTCIGTFMYIKIFLTSFTVATVVGGVYIYENILNHSFYNPNVKIVIYILLIATILRNLSQIPSNTFNARKETAKEELPLLISTIIQIVAIVFVATQTLSVRALALAYVLGAFIHFLILFYLLRSYPITKPSMDYFKSYFKFALPLMAVFIIIPISTNIDKVMIEYFVNIRAVGYYYTMQMFGRYFNLILTAVGSLLFPTISSYHANKDYAMVRKTVRLAERYISIVLTPAAMFAIIFAKPIVSIIFGNDFAVASPILQVLILMYFLNSINEPYLYQITGVDRPDVSAKITVFTIVLNIILNFLLIPEELFGIKLFGLGALGAALATLIAITVKILITRIAAYKITSTLPNGKVIFHFISAIIMGTLLILIGNIVPIVKWYLLIGFGIVGLGTYLVVLYLLREIRMEDIDFFLNTLNINEMKEYIVQELSEKET